MTGPPAKTPDYNFNKKISREVLENYLERSITMQRMLTGEGNFDDNLRMIRNIGAKFIGRAVCQWGGEADLLKNFALEKELAARVHQADPDIILQACIFEIATRQIEQVKVPDWAFKALGKPVEDRNFRYDSILYADGRMSHQWGEGGVLDVSRPETKMNKNDKDLEHLRCTGAAKAGSLPADGNARACLI